MFWNEKKARDMIRSAAKSNERVLRRVAAHLVVVTAYVTAGAGQSLADFTWGVPTNMGSIVNSSYLDAGACLSPDGLSLLFNSLRPGGSGGMDIWIVTRETTGGPWGEPMNLGPTVNSPSNDGLPEMSADGLTLYFNSNRAGGSGAEDIWLTTRATTEGEWSAPVNLGPIVNSAAPEFGASVSADGLSLYFGSQRSGGNGNYDIWVTTRATTKDDWGEPTNLGPVVNSSAASAAPEISPDRLLLFFACNRPGGYGMGDIWVTTRETVTATWTEAVNLGPAVNSSSNESTPSLSAGGSTLYFASILPGGFGAADIWKVNILPIVDFNGDGEVDGKDVLFMAEHWGENDHLCDIGPMPWGDGTVDVQDLTVLAEYIGAEIDDPTLVAHWPLDETEDMTAHDSVGDNDVAIMGAPVWRPHEGATDGALELNGMTFLVADFVLNPADGPFSVLAWIKGGAPGQVIISQQAGYNWLMLDLTTGALTTELGSGGRQSKALSCEAVITDGNWHRVSFTWDGTNRMLYLDDILVAEETDVALVECYGGMNIGCGKLMVSGTFFTGLIDDVRIYNRAVRP